MRISDWSSDVCSSDLAARRCMGFTSFHDPSGNAIDLVVRPFASGRRYVPGRDAGITGFSHVGLKTTDSRRDEAFWTGLFNFRANDWIGEAALMSFDAVHHRIALFPRSEEHTSELQSLMRISYAVFCLKQTTTKNEKRD